MAEYNIWFDVCALVAASLLLLLYSLRRSVAIFQNRVFLAMLACLWGGAAASLLSIVWEGGRVLPATVANYLVIVLDVAMGALWLVYVIASVSFRVHLRGILLVLTGPLSLLAVLLAANPFTGAVFSVDAGGHYRAGPLLAAAYAVFAFYVAYGASILIRHRRHIFPERRLALPLLLGVVAAGMAAEFLMPRLVVQQFALAMCMVIMYFSLQNPADFFDDDTGILNAGAFTQLCAGRLESGRTVQCLAVCVHGSGTVHRDTRRFLEKKALAGFGEFRRASLIFRAGEGRYVVVMDRDDAALADRAFERARELFRSLYVGVEYQARVAATMCRFACPRDAMTVDGIRFLLERAAEAGSAGGREVVRPEELDLPREQYLRSVDSLVESALAGGRLEVYYQPVWSAAEGRFCGAEALLRMRDGAGGLVPPDVFIPLAKKNGAILEIGGFVLDEVCRTIAENRLQLFGIRRVGVNFSIVESIQSSLPGRVADTLRKYSLDSSCLCFELREPESDAFDAVLDGNIRQLHGAGIMFALDSFGCGAFSLHKILQLPVAVVKLDKSVVLPAFGGGGEEARVLLECVVALAKRTGAQVLAEGVETAGAAEAVARMGCAYAQGFYYARPMPEQEFVAFIREQGGIK